MCREQKGHWWAKNKYMRRAWGNKQSPYHMGLCSLQYGVWSLFWLHLLSSLLLGKSNSSLGSQFIQKATHTQLCLIMCSCNCLLTYLHPVLHCKQHESRECLLAGSYILSTRCGTLAPALTLSVGLLNEIINEQIIYL